MDEFSVIRRFFVTQQVARGDVKINIGDDAAVVEPPSGKNLVMTADVLFEGVHFSADCPPRAVGHKALAVNLSDIAAMGAEPAWATMTLSLPEIDERWLQHFCAGLFSLAGRHRVQLVGGDLVRGPLSIGIHVTGVAQEVITRSGARSGDSVYVSGELGGAALAYAMRAGRLPQSEGDRLSERLDYPVPRVELGQSLNGVAHAAIDLSDGLAADLGHLAHASGVAVDIDLDRLPLHPAYRRYFDEMGWQGAVAFGDDYELCFTVPEHRCEEVVELATQAGTSVTAIGRVREGSGVTLKERGQPVSVADGGFRHFR